MKTVSVVLLISGIDLYFLLISESSNLENMLVSVWIINTIFHQ